MPEVLYAVILAQATNLRLTGMARASKFSYQQLEWAWEQLCREDTLTAASASLVDYHYGLPPAREWGAGQLSSSDGQRFAARGRGSGIAPLPRYFGHRRGGLQIYSWTSDQYSQYARKVITATVRDATHTLDGIPSAVVYNPEDVGAMLWKWLPRNDDFQDLASWRELVVATALSLRRHHAQTLIVPMSLIHDAYRTEILGGLTDAGEDVLHVFLEADGEELKRRLEVRGAPPGTSGSAHAVRAWAFSRVDAAVAAARRQPAGTLLLRSDQLTPGELADQVLAAVNDRRL